MAPHSSTLAWKIPWTEEPGRLQSMGSLESDTTERLHFDFSLLCIGEGNGNLLQCSCLENPRDGKPGGLLSMGSHRVGHNWSDLAAAAAAGARRDKYQQYSGRVEGGREDPKQELGVFVGWVQPLTASQGPTVITFCSWQPRMQASSCSGRRDLGLPWWLSW